ncbi:histidinol dehydrogenase, chloroplastic-like [Argentina anserina]|uniref:histidinol dehydrogenase, chloroplastic-like n=1 Tax=Argentina anserina TaxID=57926 RepID=UPI0021765B3D|nr:histidinol dehydrogenase, chloroplastic-like [Potentilla anserina]
MVVDDIRNNGDAAIRDYTAKIKVKLDKIVVEVSELPDQEGIKCKCVARSIGSVGLYVPGGTAVLPSTVLMLALVSGFLKV